MPSFAIESVVRFGHCDPAAIVFYPRYFEMISNLVEDWFSLGIGESLATLLNERGVVTPTARFEVDFVRPSRFGERLTFELQVTGTGRSSCTLGIRAVCGDELRMQVRQVLVFFDQAAGRPVRIPDDILRRMRPFIRPS